MKTIRIELQGDATDNRFCTIERPPGSPDILATILTPATPEGMTDQADAGSRESVIALAERIQGILDGIRGTNSMVFDYFCELQRFMD
jgi:hypothetical protein